MSEAITVELDVELVTDVCLSNSNRTLGEPDTATCIPGRTLWGAVASRAYRLGMSEADAFRIFHQGAVKIHDAVPVHGEHRAYPTPGAWHRPKGEPGDSVYMASNFVDDTVRQAHAGTQYRAVKEIWVAPNGQRAVPVKVKTTRSMRTSMDASGRPRDHLLFGLPAVLAGTRFWMKVSGAPGDVEQVVVHLTSGDIRLGRSRNQEMGMVRITRRATPIGKLLASTEASGKISFLCASRCLLRDPATGSATTVPFAAAFGLDGAWQFDEASSFVRTTRITHFNAKRARPESDRFAIERGSVVTFVSKTETVEPAELEARLAGGVGEHTGQGYGEVMAGPPWLTHPETEVREAPKGTPAPAPQPADELFKWASKRADGRKLALEAYTEARADAGDLRRFGVPPAQWGALHKMAREARFRGQEQVLRALFVPGGYFDSGARKLSPKWKRAKQALEKKLLKQRPEGQLALYLEHLASACMREAAERKGRDDA